MGKSTLIKGSAPHSSDRRDSTLKKKKTEGKAEKMRGWKENVCVQPPFI